MVHKLVKSYNISNKSKIKKKTYQNHDLLLKCESQIVFVHFYKLLHELKNIY